MNVKILLFSTILVTLFFTTSAVEETRASQKDINTFTMKVNEKIDYLNERMDKIEESSSTGSMAIILEEIRNEIKTTKEEFSKKFENHLEKVDKIQTLLLKFIEQKVNSSDVMNEMTSRCTTTCESKVSNLVNETSEKFQAHLENLDFCINNNNSIINDNLKTLNACDPNPCSHGGQCQLTSYSCTKCYFPWSGENCQNLTCNKDNRCFLYGGKMYIVFEENVLFNQAYEKCIGQDMGLAMPKDKQTTDFLIKQLRAVYGEVRIYFWMGLVTAAGTREYRWLDRSLLGEYTGGESEFHNHSRVRRWGILWLDGGKSVWYPRAIEGIGKGNHYALCEKSLVNQSV